MGVSVEASTVDPVFPAGFGLALCGVVAELVEALSVSVGSCPEPLGDSGFGGCGSVSEAAAVGVVVGASALASVGGVRISEAAGEV
ncbi:hypothetical protein [Nocardia coffeae]|uniref:hypothetical protein n=1 Tax=Nocardia coffeae TaxID=2873381 RepID=UPI001F35CE44|nr:hypothetical protein [Nocardia coffeae]